LSIFPWASTAAATRPINISEKYSGEPNLSHEAFLILCFL
jgi:hypothetical protein